MPELREKGLQYYMPVHIGRNCLLGAGVIIMPGITIGDEHDRKYYFKDREINHEEWKKIFMMPANIRAGNQCFSDFRLECIKNIYIIYF